MPWLAIDPLFYDGVDAVDIAVVLVKTVAVFVILLVGVMFYVWFMRKVIAVMQVRVGPKRAGPFGVLQTLADGTKLFFKEQSIPDAADSTVFRLAPYLSIMPAFLAFAIVPIGGEVWIFGRQTTLQLADPPIGILFLLMMSGIGAYGVLLAGWSSGSKYPLLGSVRASAQLLSYEAIMGLSIVTVLVRSNSLQTSAIVAQQEWNGWGSIIDWFMFWQQPGDPSPGRTVGIVLMSVLTFAGLALFLVAALGETNHPPFDLVEAEQELVGGFHTEYTGIRFAIFFLAEFMNYITMSAIVVTLFLGGPSGPPLGIASANGVVNVWLMPIFWFTVKVLFFLFCTVWVRASLPRLRYDQLMSLSWKFLIEASFLLVMVLGVAVMGVTLNWNLWLLVPGSVAAAFAIYGLLWLCVPRPHESNEWSELALADPGGES